MLLRSWNRSHCSWDREWGSLRYQLARLEYHSPSCNYFLSTSSFRGADDEAGNRYQYSRVVPSTYYWKLFGLEISSRAGLYLLAFQVRRFSLESRAPVCLPHNHARKSSSHPNHLARFWFLSSEYSPPICIDPTSSPSSLIESPLLSYHSRHDFSHLCWEMASCLEDQQQLRTANRARPIVHWGLYRGPHLDDQ